MYTYIKKSEKGGEAVFKTIYSKYLVSFIALLGIGFCCIAIIVSAVVTDYSINTKTELMDRAAKMVYDEINKDNNLDKHGLVWTIENNKNSYDGLFDIITEFSESNVIIIDKDGRVLYHNGGQNLVSKEVLSDTAMKKVESGDGTSKLSDLDGLFETKRFNYAYSVENEYDGMVGGYIVLSSIYSGMSSVFEQIIKVVLLASLWVFFAAIIIVYFITDRITTPIKQISKAVKKYAKGDFSVRIPVRGEDEIASLAEAFNNMAAELQKIDTTRNTFLSSVSHDLKTPMTSIGGFIDGILDGTIPPEKQSYYLGIVTDEVKRLTRLINTLLDVTRIQSGGIKLSPTRFDVCEMARLILISFEDKINEKQLEIEFNCDDDPSNVFADKDAIHQVIYNIISNAMKFTDKGGKIKIDIAKCTSNDKYSVSIYNTGLGIKSEELPYVFDCFYKADASRGLDKTGTGLGMYIAKSRIDAHGEKIGVESEYEKYCRFYFTLSCNEKKAQKELVQE